MEGFSKNSSRINRLSRVLKHSTYSNTKKDSNFEDFQEP